jgi:hypothetical protein
VGGVRLEEEPDEWDEDEDNNKDDDDLDEPDW